jgi:hypothetical protein
VKIELEGPVVAPSTSKMELKSKLSTVEEKEDKPLEHTEHEHADKAISRQPSLREAQVHDASSDSCIFQH